MSLPPPTNSDRARTPADQFVEGLVERSRDPSGHHGDAERGLTPAERHADLVRRYDCAKADAAALARSRAPDDLHGRMRAVVDAIWTHLHAAGVSWVGFYLPEAIATGTSSSVDPGTVTELVLGPSRNTPACSPIGLHGVCGQSFTRSAVRVIRDVRELGPDYIACDPRDRSEVVLPLLGPDGRPFAVLDVDSHEVGRFTDEDARQFRAILHAAGLPG